MKPPAQHVEQLAHRYQVTLTTGARQTVDHGLEVKVVDGVLTICGEYGSLIVSYAPGQWLQVQRVDE
jgi:hypothetical protein